MLQKKLNNPENPELKQAQDNLAKASENKNGAVKIRSEDPAATEKMQMDSLINEQVAIDQENSATATAKQTKNKLAQAKSDLAKKPDDAQLQQNLKQAQLEDQQAQDALKAAKLS